MGLWRTGHIELCDLTIAGMEDPFQFFDRGIRHLLNLAANTAPQLVIATTSIMILFDNLHRMCGPARGEGYRAREYDNTELLTLKFLTVHMDWLHLQADMRGLL